MATPLDFAKALLNRFGLPQTQNRLVGLVDFAAREGGHWGNPATRYNPMNTSLSMPGATNAVGQVKAYVSWESGVEATARTIAQSNMKPIYDALKRDADPHEILHAVTQTPWCPQNIPGCQEYDVADPMALFKSYANKQDSTVISGTGPGIVGTLRAHPYLTTTVILLGVLGTVYIYKPEVLQPVLRPMRRAFAR